jgi:hypothetical protein
MKRPGFTWYPKEWLGDLKLRQCSVAARGLWADLLCLMHDGEPYGHLTNPTDLTLRIVGLTEKAYKALLQELYDCGVPRRTDAGVIFSKRMVKDEIDRDTRAANGKYGGRPRKVEPAVKTSEPMWAEFCSLYPAHRLDEQMACQMFISRGEDAAILAGLRRAVASDDWLKDGGKFVPWASKFIADGKYTGFKASAPATQYVPYKPPT